MENDKNADKFRAAAFLISEAWRLAAEAGTLEAFKRAEQYTLHHCDIVVVGHAPGDVEKLDPDDKAIERVQ